MLVNDWKLATLGEMITLQRGYDLPYRDRRPGNIPIVTSSGISGTHAEARAKGPGVVTGRYGTVGEVFFIEEDFWPHNTTLYVNDFKGNDPLFVSFFLRTLDWQSFSGKTGVPGVNRNDLHSIDVRIPPLSEQRAIAAALSDVDALIAALDALIAKKRNIKQGAMQELLTGKKRLAGFSGEWETNTIGSVATFKNGYAFESSTYTNNGVWKIITIANVQDGFLELGEYSKIANLPRDIQSHQILSRGDILISLTGNVGRVCYVNENGCLLNQRVGKLIPKEIDREFFYHLVRQKIFIGAMMLKAKGGAQGNLSVSDIIEFELPMPSSKEEQHAIAEILSDMDAEIEGLERKRAKYQSVKQGMMQELLTGKTRLAGAL